MISFHELYKPTTFNAEAFIRCPAFVQLHKKILHGTLICFSMQEIQHVSHLADLNVSCPLELYLK